MLSSTTSSSHISSNHPVFMWFAKSVSRQWQYIHMCSSSVLLFGSNTLLIKWQISAIFVCLDLAKWKKINYSFLKECSILTWLRILTQLRSTIEIDLPYLDLILLTDFTFRVIEFYSISRRLKWISNHKNENDFSFISWIENFSRMIVSYSNRYRIYQKLHCISTILLRLRDSVVHFQLRKDH